VRWRGSFNATVHNVNDHAFEIPSHVLCGNAHGLDALFTSPKIPAHVACGIISELVSQTVDLDRESGCLAEKIEHEWAKRMLPSELQPLGPQAKHPPEPDL
jgi:hypothetical protein